MCFTADYDWYASVQEITESTTDRTAKCHECGDQIPAGAWRKYVYMQEHEFCRECEGEGCEECAEGTAWMGETFDYVCCEPCEKILKAIEALEIAEGCKPPETRPAYTELRETLTSSNYKYAAKALEMFPEVAGHLLALTE